MPTSILMPALSPTMEKGNLAKWLKKEGDTIKSGDVIAEIETDKATMEVEAVDEGVLAKIVVPEGTSDVPVNQLIGLIATEGEDAKAVAGGAGRTMPAPAPPSPKAPEPANTPPVASPGAAPAAQAQRPAPTPAPKSAAAAAPLANGHEAGARIFASPLARRVAKDAGLDIASIEGSGPHGRIVERDVKVAIEAGTARPAARPPSGAPPRAPSARPAAPTGMSEETVRKLFEPGSFTDAL